MPHRETLEFALMAIPTKSLEEMIRDVIASLQAGTRGGRPVYALLLGSGFSYPIVPTPTQMLKSDVAWWRFCKERRREGPFRNRADGVAEGLATAEEIAEFEQDLWKTIHAACDADEQKRFPLGADGLPDLTDPRNVGRAYEAVMNQGLLNDRVRRQYLREAIARSGRKVNSAHIFLAGILEVQETWDWGAPFCRTIFTTNFDPLLQRSLQLVNKLYYMTDRPDVLDAPDDDQSDALHLVYTHGSVHRYELLNTSEQIAKAMERNAARLVGYLQRHGVIVIGYSGWRDTTMEALRSCSSFDSNLYWCDIHPADQAEARLRPEVLEVLREGGKHAYYVPIPSADEAMRQLHRALKLGDVPKFILAPVPTLIEQLRSIDVPAEPGGSSASPAAPALSGNDMATLLAGTLHGLEVARLAFDDPSIVRASSPQGENEVARALVARMMGDAFVAASEGKPDQAIALWSAVISAAEVPATDRAWALYNRGVTYDLNGKPREAIDDYSAVIGMADASAEQKAKALSNRGVTHGEAGRIAEAIGDFSAVIGMADAPAEQRAMALINRGVAHGKAGRSAEAIEYYSAVIGMAEVSSERRAQALFNRGVTHGEAARSAEEIEDYSAVIGMAEAPAEQRALALVNRGVVHEEAGRIAEAIEDYSAVIGMAEATAEQKARALLNRGNAHGKAGRIAEAIEDYSAVIGMTDATAEQKAKALLNRGNAHGEAGRSAEAIEDYSAVIGMADAPAEQKAKALLNRGNAHGEAKRIAEASEDYSAVIGTADAPAVEKAKALLNRGVAHREAGRNAEAIEDYSVVIGMADAKAEQRADALLNRGVAHKEAGRNAEAIEDYSMVIGMADASAEQRADALLNRGVAHGEAGRSAEGIEDYSVVIEMEDVSAELKASAFVSRSWVRFKVIGDVDILLDGSRKALELAPENTSARMNLALALLLMAETDAAMAEYERLLSQTSDEAVIREAIGDLEAEMEKRPDLPGAERALALLESAAATGKPGGSG
jgi:tetratricopeptide (TPR) repeat protein